MTNSDPAMREKMTKKPVQIMVNGRIVTLSPTVRLSDFTELAKALGATVRVDLTPNELSSTESR